MPKSDIRSFLGRIERTRDQENGIFCTIYIKTYEIPKNFACGAFEGPAGRTTYPKVGAL